MNYPKDPLLPHQPVNLGGYTRLSPMRIIRLGAERNYTFIYREDGKKILISVTLKKVEELLKPSGLFIRVNRKDAINVNYIQKWNSDGTLILKNGELITPSRRRINRLNLPPLF
jgi:two-component system, LytTR family, response regulator